MKLKKLVIILLSLITLGLISVFLLHVPIANFILNRELAERGLPVVLNLEEISPEHIRLRNIKIGKQNKLEYLNVDFQLSPHLTIQKIDAKLADYDIEEIKTLDFSAEDSHRSSHKSTTFQICRFIEQTNFKLDVEGLESILGIVSCKKDLVRAQIENLHYQNIGPLNLKLEANLSKTPIQSQFDITLEDKTISKGQLSYTLDEQHLHIDLEEAEKSIELSLLIEKLMPDEMKAQILSSSGLISFSGKIDISDEELNFEIDFKADKVNIATEEYKAKDIRLRHSIVEFPSLKSKKSQKFTAKELVAGAKIEDVSITYDVISKDVINVRSLQMKSEGTKIKAKHFKLFLDKNQASPLDIRLDQLSLEKFLKLALGETATATGILDGQIKLKFVNDKPIIESGKLKAKANGVIQYRPPTSKGPPDPNSYSTDPMEILNNYLYDFHYSDLSVTMSSDANFEMKMKMTALGRNPGYLNGKALKLNVNLEQNLLAAFQAMMLSYNLPKRLEEKITNLGK